MNYPKNELAQLVIAYCEAYRVQDVVISPGSRNAPLTIGFTNHPKIRAYSIADERCAAFFALGIAQQKKAPVAVVCTSGTAVLNYYPAVAEAFYSSIPLIVISADRPKHLIDIGDGQTIRQENVLEKHVYHNANLIADPDAMKENSASLQLALQTATNKRGPVHINVPFDEPLYETVDHAYFEILAEDLATHNSDFNEVSSMAQRWNEATQKMILVGAHESNKELQKLLDFVAQDPSVIVLTETTSNLHHRDFINSIDKLIMPLDEHEFSSLRPTILLTFGGMIVSKKIKRLLRKHQPETHWHIDTDRALDTYFALSKHFKLSPYAFFSQFKNYIKSRESTYQERWLALKKQRANRHLEFMNSSAYSDLVVFQSIFNSMPSGIQLQLGNSSVVRYAQLFDLEASSRVYCNRGTSGIDGSTSTAIGAATVNTEQTVFISGDISFFYDSNALWNTYIPKSFRMILINNSGGGIFRFIEGPQTTNALDYFESPHALNAAHLCAMYNIHYSKAENEEEVKSELANFYDESAAPKLLEIFTPREENDKVLKAYFRALK